MALIIEKEILHFVQNDGKGFLTFFGKVFKIKKISQKIFFVKFRIFPKIFNLLKNFFKKTVSNLFHFSNKCAILVVWKKLVILIKAI